MGKTTKLLSNIKYNTLGIIVSLIAGLFLSPIIVHTVGVEKYGLFVVISAITANVVFFDMGVGDTFGRFIGAATALNDHRAIQKNVNAGFFFYLFLSLLSVAVLLPSQGLILKFFKVNPELKHEAMYVYCCGVVTFFVGYTFNIFSGILYGLQRLDLINKVNITNTIITFLATIGVLEMGFGLKGLMSVGLCSAICIAVVNWILVKRVAPYINISFKHFNLDSLKKMMRVGIQLQAQRVTKAIYNSISSVIVGKTLSLDMVAYYNIANRIGSYLQIFPGLLNSGTIPLAAGFSATNEEEKNYVLYEKIAGYSGAIVFPAIFGVWLVSRVLLAAWMGPGFDESVLALNILAPGMLFYATSSVVGSIFSSNMHIAKVTVISVSGVVLILTLSIVLAYYYKLVGVCLGIAVSLFALSTIYHIVFNVTYRKNMLLFLYRYWLGPLSAASLVYFIFMLLAPNIATPLVGRGPNILRLFEIVAVFGTAYLSLLVIFRYPQKEDLSALAKNSALARIIICKCWGS